MKKSSGAEMILIEGRKGCGMALSATVMAFKMREHFKKPAVLGMIKRPITPLTETEFLDEIEKRG